MTNYFGPIKTKRINPFENFGISGNSQAGNNYDTPLFSRKSGGEKSYSSIESDYLSAASNISSTSNSASLKQERDSLNSEVDGLRQQKNENTNSQEVQSAKTDLSQAQSEYQQALTEFGDKNKDNEAIQSLQQEKAEKQGLVEQAQSQIDSVNGNISSTQGEIESLHGQLASLSQPSQSSFMTTVTNEKGETETKPDTAAYAAAMAEYEAQKAAIESQIQAAEAQLQAYQQELTSAQQTLQEAQQASNEIDSKIQEATSEMANNGDENAQAVQEALSRYQQAQQAVQEAENKSKEDNQEIEQNINDKLNQIQALDAQIAQAEAQEEQERNNQLKEEEENPEQTDYNTPEWGDEYQAEAIISTTNVNENITETTEGYVFNVDGTTIKVNDPKNTIVKKNAVTGEIVIMGAVDAEVTLSDGAKVTVYESSVKTLNAKNGNEEINIKGTHTTINEILGYDGDDTDKGQKINVSQGAKVNKMELGNGNNVLRAENANLGKIKTKNGQNEINIYNSVVDQDIESGSGEDKVTLYGTHVKGNIYTGGGDDKLRILKSTTDGEIQGNSGHDKIIANNSTINGNTYIGDEYSQDDINIFNTTYNGSLSTYGNDENNKNNIVITNSLFSNTSNIDIQSSNNIFINNSTLSSNITFNRDLATSNNLNVNNSSINYINTGLNNTNQLEINSIDSAINGSFNENDDNSDNLHINKMTTSLDTSEGGEYEGFEKFSPEINGATHTYTINGTTIETDNSGEIYYNKETHQIILNGVNDASIIGGSNNITALNSNITRQSDVDGNVIYDNSIAQDIEAANGQEISATRSTIEKVTSDNDSTTINVLNDSSINTIDTNKKGSTLSLFVSNGRIGNVWAKNTASVEIETEEKATSNKIEGINLKDGNLTGNLNNVEGGSVKSENGNIDLNINGGNFDSIENEDGSSKIQASDTSINELSLKGKKTIGDSDVTNDVYLKDSNVTTFTTSNEKDKAVIEGSTIQDMETKKGADEITFKNSNITNQYINNAEDSTVIVDGSTINEINVKGRNAFINGSIVRTANVKGDSAIDASYIESFNIKKEGINVYSNYSDVNFFENSIGAIYENNFSSQGFQNEMGIDISQEESYKYQSENNTAYELVKDIKSQQTEEIYTICENIAPTELNAIQQEHPEYNKEQVINEIMNSDNTTVNALKDYLFKEIESSLNIKGNDVQGELDARGIGGYIDYANDYQTYGEESLNRRKAAYESLNESSDIYEVLSTYAVVVGGTADGESLNNSIEAVKYAQSLDQESFGEVIYSLECIGKDLEHSLTEQDGNIKEIISDLNVIVDFGTNKEEAMAYIDTYKKEVQSLKEDFINGNLDPIEFAAKYKTLTGNYFNSENVNTLTDIYRTNDAFQNRAQDEIQNYQETQQQIYQTGEFITVMVGGIAVSVATGGVASAGTLGTLSTMIESMGSLGIGLTSTTASYALKMGLAYAERNTNQILEDDLTSEEAATTAVLMCAGCLTGQAANEIGTWVKEGITGGELLKKFYMKYGDTFAQMAGKFSEVGIDISASAGINKAILGDADITGEMQSEIVSELIGLAMGYYSAKQYNDMKAAQDYDSSAIKESADYNVKEQDAPKDTNNFVFDPAQRYTLTKAMFSNNEISEEAIIGLDLLPYTVPKNDFDNALTTELSKYDEPTRTSILNKLNLEQKEYKGHIYYEGEISELGLQELNTKETAGIYKIVDDYQNTGIPLEYSRRNFISDLNKEIPIEERESVANALGIEFIEENGEIVGYDGLIDTTKINSLDAPYREFINRFINENKITTGNEAVDIELNNLIKEFPEFINIIGKKQHSTHNYTLDCHIINALQECISDPRYKNLSEEDKICLKVATILHDIGKNEFTVDKAHPETSKEFARKILANSSLPVEMQERILDIIGKHHWLENVSNENISASSIADSFKYKNDYDIAVIMAEADLRAIKTNNAFFDRFGGALSNTKQKLIAFLAGKKTIFDMDYDVKVSKPQADGSTIETYTKKDSGQIEIHKDKNGYVVDATIKDIYYSENGEKTLVVSSKYDQDMNLIESTNYRYEYDEQSNIKHITEEVADGNGNIKSRKQFSMETIEHESGAKLITTTEKTEIENGQYLGDSNASTPEIKSCTFEVPKDKNPMDCYQDLCKYLNDTSISGNLDITFKYGDVELDAYSVKHLMNVVGQGNETKIGEFAQKVSEATGISTKNVGLLFSIKEDGTNINDFIDSDGNIDLSKFDKTRIEAIKIIESSSNLDRLVNFEGQSFLTGWENSYLAKQQLVEAIGNNEDALKRLEFLSSGTPEANEVLKIITQPVDLKNVIESESVFNNALNLTEAINTGADYVDLQYGDDTVRLNLNSEFLNRLKANNSDIYSENLGRAIENETFAKNLDVLAQIYDGNSDITIGEGSDQEIIMSGINTTNVINTLNNFNYYDIIKIVGVGSSEEFKRLIDIMSLNNYVPNEPYAFYQVKTIAEVGRNSEYYKNTVALLSDETYGDMGIIAAANLAKTPFASSEDVLNIMKERGYKPQDIRDEKIYNGISLLASAESIKDSDDISKAYQINKIIQMNYFNILNNSGVDIDCLDEFLSITLSGGAYDEQTNLLYENLSEFEYNDNKDYTQNSELRSQVAQELLRRLDYNNKLLIEESSCDKNLASLVQKKGFDADGFKNLGVDINKLPNYNQADFKYDPTNDEAFVANMSKALNDSNIDNINELKQVTNVILSKYGVSETTRAKILSNISIDNELKSIEANTIAHTDVNGVTTYETLNQSYEEILQSNIAREMRLNNPDYTNSKSITEEDFRAFINERIAESGISEETKNYILDDAFISRTMDCFEEIAKYQYELPQTKISEMNQTETTINGHKIKIIDATDGSFSGFIYSAGALNGTNANPDVAVLDISRVILGTDGLDQNETFSSSYINGENGLTYQNIGVVFETDANSLISINNHDASTHMRMLAEELYKYLHPGDATDINYQGRVHEDTRKQLFKEIENIRTQYPDISDKEAINILIEKGGTTASAIAAEIGGTIFNDTAVNEALLYNPKVTAIYYQGDPNTISDSVLQFAEERNIPIIILRENFE